MSDDAKIIPFPNSERQEAVRRILDAERTGQTWLDLGDLGLKELPLELGELTQLRHLALGANRLVFNSEEQVDWLIDPDRKPKFTDLSPLVRLTRLSSLDLQGCCSVSDLRPLEKHTALTRLDISFCELVSDLGPLAKLELLTHLDISHCDLVSNLGPLGKLAALTTLIMDHCDSVSDLGPLGELTTLATLNLRECKSVSDLGPLGKLTALTELEIVFCNLVSDLGPLENLTALTTLTIDRCDLVSDLRPLANLISLAELSLRYCKSVTDLGPLGKLTALTNLHIDLCDSLSDLGPLGNVTALTELSIFFCALVSDLGPLANLTALTSLSIVGCQLVQDIESLSNLTLLTSLTIGGCKLVTEIEPLENLTALTTLSLHGCKSVMNLEPLAKLTALTNLRLSECHSITNLEPLANLIALTALDLSESHEVFDLGPLRRLLRLTSLDVRACFGVSDLRPLRKLAVLTRLDVSQCKSLTDLTPLRKLDAMVTLIINGCQSVSDLSALLALPALKQLHLQGTAVPLPDHLKYSTDAPTILAWFREDIQATGKRPLPEVKLLLVGQGRVGKTHIRRRLFGSEGIAHHDTRLEPTQHIDYTEWTTPLPNNHATQLVSIKLRVWDFGGQNELHCCHRFFLGAQRCFYVLVIAADRPANGESIDSNRLNYWLRMLAHYGEGTTGKKAPVLIVVTRSDLKAAESRRGEIVEALATARHHSWFEANVVEVVQGLGWSRSLSETNDSAIWDRHQSAATAISEAINTHLVQVPDLTEAIPSIYHVAKEFMEKAFSIDGIDHDRRMRTCIAGDDQERFAELFERSEGQTTDEQRRSLSRACLGLLNSLGVVHWVGDVPAIARDNPWHLRDIAFNPEWVRRPVYDLIRCSAAEPELAGFLSYRQIDELLAERKLGDPSGGDLFEQVAFTPDDRGRVLELMKACRLVFANVVEDGMIVPDLLAASSLSDETVVTGGWKFVTDFLPEKVFLRFIARQYAAIDHHADRCYRNRVIWRKEGGDVQLSAYYSPSGAALPFILIRSTTPKLPIPETVAMSLEALLNEVCKDEGLARITPKLLPAGESLHRPDGPFVFRYKERRVAGTRNRETRTVTDVTIVINGVDLAANWRHLTGLGYLYLLVRHAGQQISVDEFSKTQRYDASQTYRFTQTDQPAESTSAAARNSTSKFATYSTKKLKQAHETAEKKLVQAASDDTNTDSLLEEKLEREIEELRNEIERRENRAVPIKTAMNTIQQALKKAVEELTQQMKDKGVPQAYWNHFEHCTSSEEHPYHFAYRPAISVEWDTD